MNKKFEDYINALEKKGYMVTRESNDVDRIKPPGDSVTIIGWYKDMNVETTPPGLNWHFFSGEEVEKFAEELRKAGYDVFIHGWYQGKFISGVYTECWIYDVEIVEPEDMGQDKGAIPGEVLEVKNGKEIICKDHLGEGENDDK